MGIANTPEENARRKIDWLLEQCGWIVQDADEINISAARGIAMREFPLATGFADYMLYADAKAIGKRWQQGNSGRDVAFAGVDISCRDFPTVVAALYSSCHRFTDHLTWSQPRLHRRPCCARRHHVLTSKISPAVP